MKKTFSFSLWQLIAISLFTVIIIVSLITGMLANSDRAVGAESSQVKSPTDGLGWKENSDNKVKLQWYVNFSWFITKWGDDPVSRKITELTGIDVEYVVPRGNEIERISSMIAADSLPDLLTIGRWDSAINEMIALDMLAPLNKLAQEYDLYFFDVASPERLRWFTKEDGNVYGYPNASFTPSSYESTTESNQTFLVRKDIYEAIGSPDMSTPDGFLNALSAAKEKFPSVGGEALIPLGLGEFNEIGNDSIEGYLQNFLAIPNEVNGKVYDRFTDPDYIIWLKTLRKANEMGLISREIFIDKRMQMEEKIANKQYFAMLYQWSDCQTQIKTIYAQNPEQAYIAIDGPKNAKGSNHQLSGPSMQGWTLTMISKKSPHKDRAIQLMSMLMSEEGQKLIWAGVEGQGYDMVDGKVVFKPEAIDLLNKDRLEFDKKYGSMSTHWALMDNEMAAQKGFMAPDVEPLLSIKKWTNKYVVDNSIYDYISLMPDTPAAIAKKKIDQEKSRTMQSLILAKSDIEFDEIFEQFIEKRKKYGFDLIMAEYQKELETNKKRLGNN